MASNIATGALSRTHASPAGAWCSGTLLYLGEINDCSGCAWRQVDRQSWRNGGDRSRGTLSLFPEDRVRGPARWTPRSFGVRLNELQSAPAAAVGRRAGWRMSLWRELAARSVSGAQRLPARAAKGTHSDQVLLRARRLPAAARPGSEWRLHRQWFGARAWPICSGERRRAAQRSHKLYRCHDRSARSRRTRSFDASASGVGGDLFNVSFDVLLYDLTSTYFEADPPFPEGDKRRFGYSRDHRPDCAQVVIALVVTPEGLPLAYEVLPGNTTDSTTLRDFLGARSSGCTARRVASG